MINFIETADYLLSEDERIDVQLILLEEAPNFWNGTKTAEQTAAIIQNRVQNFLNERN